MARIRTIKPEFCTSEQLAECSMNARLLFALMWCFCDDGGVHPDSPKRLKMECFPADDITSADVAQWVNELVAHNLLARYEVEGQGFLRVTGWDKHQKIDQPTFKFPREDGDVPSSVRRTSAERSPKDQRKDTDHSSPERSRVESKGKESSSLPPSSVALDWDGIEDEIWQMANLRPDGHRVAGKVDDFRIVRSWRDKGFTADEVRQACRSVIGRAGEIRSLWKLLAAAVPDEIGKLRTEASAPPSKTALERDADQWRARLIGWRDNRLWLPSWGPKPGEPHCEAPADILVEFGFGTGVAA